MIDFGLKKQTKNQYGIDYNLCDTVHLVTLNIIRSHMCNTLRQKKKKDMCVISGMLSC